MTTELIRAKHRQAAALMPRHGIDTWIIQFGRETGNRPDPLGYLVGAKVTWPSAFLLDKSGRSCAIVGSGDSGTVKDTGVWDEVRAYRNSAKGDLLDVLAQWRPERIGVSWDASDNTADGITMGMYRSGDVVADGRVLVLGAINQRFLPGLQPRLQKRGSAGPDQDRGAADSGSMSSSLGSGTEGSPRTVA